MKRIHSSILIMIVTTFLIAAPSPGDFSESRYTGEGNWEEQMRGMGYLILHLSSINAINGMNLTQEQALCLRQMAQEVEASSNEIPDFKAAYRPDLAEVRDTYLEVREYIIAGKEVPEQLEKKVVKARSIESTVVRLSLSRRKWARSSCLRCHAEPGIKDVRLNKRITANLNQVSCPIFTGYERQMFLAHMGGVFGRKGMLKLMAFSAEVDRLLTDSQKKVLQTFTCCLTPPKELSDPVRAGQAASGEKEIEILRAVRKVPASLWSYARSRGLKKLEQLLVFKTPGITDDKVKALCDRVSEIYEKARALSDVDFEMDKDLLAAELKNIGTPKREITKRQQDYMNALFLLIPGSTEVYDNIIKRSD